MFIQPHLESAATPNISPIAFLVDSCENVYVSGWGGVFDTDQFQSSGTNQDCQ